jgi:hypothetical protein
MNRLLICAGDHRQADTLAWLMKLPKSAWSYIDNPDRLLGHRGMTLLMWGTWRERADDITILETAKVMDMTILYIHDGRG